MFSIFLRRIQRILLPIKILIILGALLLMGYLVINFSPSIGLIAFFSFLLFTFFSIIFNFFLSANRSLLTALAVAFILFLRAVSLLSVINLALLALFLLLLGLYCARNRVLTKRT